MLQKVIWKILEIKSPTKGNTYKIFRNFQTLPFALLNNPHRLHTFFSQIQGAHIELYDPISKLSTGGTIVQKVMR